MFVSYILNTSHAQVKYFICGWLAWLLRMKRPGGSTTKKALTQRAQVKDMKLGELEDKSKSLMANVLDMEDDPRMVNGNTTGFLLKVSVKEPKWVSKNGVTYFFVCVNIE